MVREKISRLEGPELHRLKSFTDYDPETFNKMYKEVKPLIVSLSYQINLKLFDVSRDIIQSYFEDKFLYVYNKYHTEYDYPRLKGVIILSLKTFKNKLLSRAYGEQANFFLNTARFEDMKYDTMKDEEDEEEDDFSLDIEDIDYEDRNSFLEDAIKYIKKHLTEDEFLIFTAEMDPPEFFTSRIKRSRGRITLQHLMEFFGLPDNKRSKDFLKGAREKIKRVISETRYKM